MCGVERKVNCVEGLGFRVGLLIDFHWCFCFVVSWVGGEEGGRELSLGVTQGEAVICRVVDGDGHLIESVASLTIEPCYVVLMFSLSMVAHSMFWFHCHLLLRLVTLLSTSLGDSVVGVCLRLPHVREASSPSV